MGEWDFGHLRKYGRLQDGDAGWSGLIILALGDWRGFYWWYWPVPHSDGTFSLI